MMKSLDMVLIGAAAIAFLAITTKSEKLLIQKVAGEVLLESVTG